MEQNRIKPEKITKPIQLLAVWFSGLIIFEGLLLTGARTIESPDWITPMLSITSVVIIPLFLFFIFLLQTKYRPQMQEDSFYSKYLDKSTQKLLIAKEENSNLVQSQKQILGKEKSNVAQDKVVLNRLLPNFKEIRMLLLKEKIKNFNEFTPGISESPKEFLITVGMDVSINFLIKIIELLKPFGFILINSTIDADQMEKNLSMHEIVIGSYALNRKERITLEIDDELIETIKNIDSKKVFHNILKK